MAFLNVGVGHCGLLELSVILVRPTMAVSATAMSVDGRGSRPAPPVRLGPELALQLHQAPDPGAIGTDVWLDVSGQLADGGQVDAEQLRAPLQRRRDRPAHVRSCQVPTGLTYRTQVGERIEGCVVRQGSSAPGWGRNAATHGQPGAQRATISPSREQDWHTR